MGQPRGAAEPNTGDGGLVLCAGGTAPRPCSRCNPETGPDFFRTFVRTDANGRSVPLSGGLCPTTRGQPVCRVLPPGLFQRGIVGRLIGVPASSFGAPPV